MRLVSINVGRPRVVEWRGDMVTTAIFKVPVSGTVTVKALNIDGDGQADLTVHGGERKAVYVYPSEHYAYWRTELPDADLPHGAFGENLTTDGLLEADVGPGDVLDIGTATFAVTVPRMPCYKLGLRFGRLDMVKRFWRSRRSGFYLSVLREGAIAAGDPIRLTRQSEDRPSIETIFTSRDAGRTIEA
jgi:MOSC domain-containing protein YiiM